MPKKSTAARSAMQRNKSRVQKNFELVRPTSTGEQVLEEKTSAEQAPVSTTQVAISTTTSPVALVETSEVPKKQESAPPEPASTTTKGSAASRLAARRQGTQKTQQRSSAALITPEHYAYVRRDLIFIAILAAIMFSAIIILHFVPGIGS